MYAMRLLPETVAEPGMAWIPPTQVLTTSVGDSLTSIVHEAVNPPANTYAISILTGGAVVPFI